MRITRADQRTCDPVDHPVLSASALLADCSRHLTVRWREDNHLIFNLVSFRPVPLLASLGCFFTPGYDKRLLRHSSTLPSGHLARENRSKRQIARRGPLSRPARYASRICHTEQKLDRRVHIFLPNLYQPLVTLPPSGCTE